MKVGYFEAQHDFYAILGIRESATVSEIRGAYRRLVWELHPDRMGGGGERGQYRIKLVNMAATVLLNSAARARYDELRQAARTGRLSSPFSSPSGPPSRQSRGPTAVHRARRRRVAVSQAGPLIRD